MQIRSALIVCLLGLTACGGEGQGTPPPSKNTAPTLTSVRFDFDEDTTLSTQLIAGDAEGQLVTFAKSSDPQQGSLTLSASGALVYTPSLNYSGTDLFGVTITDSAGAQASATISLVVRPVNDAPVLTSLRFDLDEDTTLTGQLTATDAEGQSITFSKAMDSAQGVATVSATGALTFVPAQNFNGTALLSVMVTDSLGAQSTRDVVLVVRPINDAPVARDDELRVPTGAPVTLSLLANDTDVDGDQLNITVTSQARGGTVTVNPGNVVTLTPDASYSGPMMVTYRVTDAAGVTADATAHLVVGNFAGIVYIADEVTPGTYDLMYYDGFRAVRLNSQLEPGFVLKRFALSGNGRRVAYVANGGGFDRVFVVDVASPGAARSIFTTTPTFPNTYAGTRIQLNYDGSLALVFDSFAPLNSRWWLVSATGVANLQRIGGNNPDIVEYSNVYFGGGGSDLWVVARHSGVSSPGSQTGFLTIYRGSSASAATLQQVATDYSPAGGGGPGVNLRITEDGQNVVHAAINYVSGNVADLRTIDRTSNTETYLFRQFASFEFPAPLEFDVNSTGDAVCFRVNQIGASSSTGPGSFYVANPKAPGSAVVITPVADFNMFCQWASDGRRMAFQSGTNTAGGIQWKLVDRLAPLSVGVLNAPLAPGESLGNGTLARKRPVGIYVVAPFSGPITSLHRVNLDQPGVATRLIASWESGYPFEGQTNPMLNPEGTMLAYRKGTTNPRLYMVSTETVEYEIPLTRSDALLGVIQAQWVPEP